jgi:hypothetical protein
LRYSITRRNSGGMTSDMNTNRKRPERRFCSARPATATVVAALAGFEVGSDVRGGLRIAVRRGTGVAAGRWLRR